LAKIKLKGEASLTEASGLKEGEMIISLFFMAIFPIFRFFKIL